MNPDYFLPRFHSLAGPHELDELAGELLRMAGEDTGFRLGLSSAGIDRAARPDWRAVVVPIDDGACSVFEWEFLLVATRVETMEFSLVAVPSVPSMGRVRSSGGPLVLYWHLTATDRLLSWHVDSLDEWG